MRVDVFADLSTWLYWSTRHADSTTGEATIGILPLPLRRGAFVSPFPRKTKNHQGLHPIAQDEWPVSRRLRDSLVLEDGAVLRQSWYLDQLVQRRWWSVCFRKDCYVCRWLRLLAMKKDSTHHHADQRELKCCETYCKIAQLSKSSTFH